jgi:hypothetical protein
MKRAKFKDETMKKSSSKRSASKSSENSIAPGTKWLLAFANLMGGPPGGLNPSIAYLSLHEEIIQNTKGRTRNAIDYSRQRVNKLEKLTRDGRLVHHNNWIFSPDKNNFIPAGKVTKFSIKKFKQLILKRGIPPYEPNGSITIREYPRYDPLRQCKGCNRKKLYCNPKCKKNRDTDFFTRNPFKLNLHKNTSQENRAGSELVFHCAQVSTGLENIIYGSNGSGNVIPRSYQIQKLGYPLWPVINWDMQEARFIHDGTIPQAIISFFLDFCLNQKELHHRLRQCPCCGQFFIAKTKRGMFCTSKCRDRFHQKNKEEDRKRKKAENKYHSEKKKSKELEELSKLIAVELDDTGDTGEIDSPEKKIVRRKKARKEAIAWISAGKTLKQYKARYGL